MTTMRVLMPIVNDRRIKGAPKEVEVWLERAEADDVCPITQEPIEQSGVPFGDEGACFCEGRPELNALRLGGCGHKFSALNLVYHWVRSHSVRCPVCRQGVADAHLKRTGLPAHLRRAMVRRVTEEQSRDRAEAMEEDEREAQRLGEAIFGGEHGFVIELAEAVRGGVFGHTVHPWCMARLRHCCIELRMEDETVGVFRDLSSTMFADRIVFEVVVDLPYRPFRVMGGVDHLRFPSSRTLGPAERGLVNLSYPLSATQYWVEVGADDGRIKQVNFEVMIDLFCVLALEQDQLRLLNVFAGSI